MWGRKKEEKVDNAYADKVIEDSKRGSLNTKEREDAEYVRGIAGRLRATEGKLQDICYGEAQRNGPLVGLVGSQASTPDPTSGVVQSRPLQDAMDRIMSLEKSLGVIEKAKFWREDVLSKRIDRLTDILQLLLLETGYEAQTVPASSEHVVLVKSKATGSGKK